MNWLMVCDNILKSAERMDAPEIMQGSVFSLFCLMLILIQYISPSMPMFLPSMPLPGLWSTRLLRLLTFPPILLGIILLFLAFVYTVAFPIHGSLNLM